MIKEDKSIKSTTPRLPSFENFNIGNDGNLGSYSGIGTKGSAPFLSLDRLPSFYGFMSSIGGIGTDIGSNTGSIGSIGAVGGY